ncbi:methionine ABC transporter ATP-binding protein [Alicyclobacillus fructus]|uniref:methionine ABC transporter ATP-binding protein n=1 Tax=Alicyclobacillus fructus TaxID=2816082 RepID=UPI001F1C363A|nr:ATP-binding cassette domain-containing protein [Alicyclobacillus fructus]
MLLIWLDGITHVYESGNRPVVALDDVTLHIEAGDIFGVIGFSGAGKSTLLRTINLLEKPSRGRVVVDGRELTALPKRELQEARKRIGMIFQHFHLLKSATVEENVQFPLALAKVPSQKAKRRVEDLLALVGLEGYEKHYPAQLSGGQKQRVAIARALANDPVVLLCDEATSALDPETTQSILDLLVDIHQKLGVTMVVVTHEMSVVSRICRHVAVMEQGKIVEQGGVIDVLLEPKSAVAKRLLGKRDGQLAGRFPGYEVKPDALLCEAILLGDLAYSPVLAQVAATHGVTFTILSGTVDVLGGKPYSHMVLDWHGDLDSVQAAWRRLRDVGAKVRPLRLAAAGEFELEVTG